MTRVAAIDCGTNSIRLLVADLDGTTLVDVDRRMEIVRLGEGVDRTGRLAPEALRRTFAACDRYAQVVRDTGAERVRFVATSASRDVDNRDEFVTGVRDRLGVEPEVISGDTEATLSFIGATRELLHSSATPPDIAGPAADKGSLGRSGGSPEPRSSGGEVESPVLVVDIGGGSTEFVLGDPGQQPTAARSVDIGCVRMTERHLHDDPPTAKQVAAARSDIDAGIRLAATSVPLDTARAVVGLAGSVTTVAAMALDLPAYLPERIHHSRIQADDVRRVAERLLAMTHDQRAALPFMHPGRVDVIGAGALVLSELLDHLPVDEVVVSEHDILDGIAWSLIVPDL